MARHQERRKSKEELNMAVASAWRQQHGESKWRHLAARCRHIKHGGRKIRRHNVGVRHENSALA